MPRNKSSRRGGSSRLWCSLHVQRPCLSWSAWLWELVNEFLFLLCLSITLLLSLLNYHYLSPWVFSPSFCFLLSHWRWEWTRCWGGVRLLAEANPPQLPSTWMTLWFYDISSCAFSTYFIGLKKYLMKHRNYPLKSLDCPKSLKVFFFLCGKHERFWVGQYWKRTTDQLLWRSYTLILLFLPSIFT